MLSKEPHRARTTSPGTFAHCSRNDRVAQMQHSVQQLYNILAVAEQLIIEIKEEICGTELEQARAARGASESETCVQ